MDAVTLREVSELIMEVRFDHNGGFELVNELYGLYDGYLYDSLLINAENAGLPKEVFRRIIKIWVKVSKYPMIHYFAGSNEDEGPEYDSAGYSESDRLGVADGKAVLESIS